MNGIFPFGKAQVGELAHTWENATGDWGEYTFEMVDPLETHDRYDLAAIGPITRKLWRLVDVVEITVTPTDDIDDDEDSA